MSAQWDEVVYLSCQHSGTKWVLTTTGLSCQHSGTKWFADYHRLVMWAQWDKVVCWPSLISHVSTMGWSCLSFMSAQWDKVICWPPLICHVSMVGQSGLLTTSDLSCWHSGLLTTTDLSCQHSGTKKIADHHWSVVSAQWNKVVCWPSQISHVSTVGQSGLLTATDPLFQHSGTEWSADHQSTDLSCQHGGTSMWHNMVCLRGFALDRLFFSPVSFCTPLLCRGADWSLAAEDMDETGPLCWLAGSSLHVSVKELVKEDVSLLECMYLVLACMPGERVTVGDSGLCCCVCVTSSERQLTLLFVDSG